MTIEYRVNRKVKRINIDPDNDAVKVIAGKSEFVQVWIHNDNLAHISADFTGTTVVGWMRNGNKLTKRTYSLDA